MRIAIAGILHESNTFASTPTGLDVFRIHRGPALLEAYADTFHELTGFLDGAAECGFEPVPILAAVATPSGTVTRDAFDSLTDELLTALRDDDSLDGVLLALHGAMASEEHLDADGEIIRRVRETIGDIPIIVTHDFHANISAQRTAHSDALFVYQTNPHVDQRPTGLKAARLMERMVAGEVQPTQALVKPDTLVNIRFQNTSLDPLASVMALARQVEQQSGVLGISVVGAYQYADVPAMGPSIVVVTDNDDSLAADLAGRLNQQINTARDQLRLNLPTADSAVAQAVASASPPVVLVEMGDNIGGGSAGDSTIILAELLRQNAPGWLIPIYDPAAASRCAQLGAGAEVELTVGGHTDELHGEPVAVTGRVVGLHDGKFEETECRHGGARFWDQGQTAVVEVPVEGGEPGCLVVNSLRTPPFSLCQLTSLGLKPETKRILVVKAAIAFRAAYEPIAGQIIEVDTPGLTAINPARFNWKHANAEMWGMNPATDH